MNTFVSVIIPVYNDVESLKKCLNALKSQTYPQAQFEIIVVNNGSTQNLNIDEHKNVQLVYEAQPGSFIARNKGLDYVQGEIIAFLDADCVPESAWLEEGVNLLIQDRKIGAVGGAITFTFEGSRPNTIELYDSLLFLQQKKYVEQIGIAVTANLFTKNKMVDEIGKFDGSLRSGGDGEWCKRVTDNGYVIAYSKSALVYHPARKTLLSLLNKVRRVTGGKFQRENRADETFFSYWNLGLREFLFGIKRIFAMSGTTNFQKTK